MHTFRKPLAAWTCAFFALAAGCQCSTVRGSSQNSKKFQNEVKYYEGLIQSELQKALQYELPTNANMYKPTDNVIRDFGTFDFIIIGAGSTGSVIASRLSEISKWKVLLLEAGKYPNNFTVIPGFFAIQAMTEYNWGFVSTPQKTACLGAIENRCVVPRGRGVGGTSLLNQLIYSRGNPIDYNRWSELLGDTSWQYHNILEYFKKSEDFHNTNLNAPLDWDYHGKEGPWYTKFHNPPSNFTKFFLEANRELGNRVTDYNGKEQLGATVLQLNIKEGRRHDQATAFIKPVIDRSNLFISTESYVTKIEIDNETKEVTGVLFTNDKALYRAKISKEVILSAGAISSPQILMLSGIGPKSHLRSKNISVIQDLEVGSSLKDHVFCPIQFSSNASTSEQSFEEQIKEYLQGYGDMAAGNPIDAAGWYKTDLEPTPGYPDLEIVPTYFSPSEFGQKFLRWKPELYQEFFNFTLNSPFSLTLILLHTKSAGTVRLLNNDPYSYPEIDYNSLSDTDKRDIGTLFKGMELAINITQTPAFKKINATLANNPLKVCLDTNTRLEDYLECYLRHISIPAFHPVGTCPSGQDPKKGAVVDWNLNVFGVKKLRVADASVIPFTFSGHPSAICTMIGEKIADVIKFEHRDILTEGFK